MSISKPLLIYTEHSWAGSGPVLEKAHRGTDTMALCLLLWGTAGRVGGQCAGASSTPSSWVGRMTEMLFLYQLQDFGQVIQQRSWGSQSPRPRQCVPRGMSSQELVTTAHSFPSPWSRPFWWMSWLRQGTTWPQPRNNLWSDWGPGRELTRIEFSPLRCVHGYVGLYPLSDIYLNGESMPAQLRLPSPFLSVTFAGKIDIALPFDHTGQLFPGLPPTVKNS